LQRRFAVTDDTFLVKRLGLFLLFSWFAKSLIVFAPRAHRRVARRTPRGTRPGQSLGPCCPADGRGQPPPATGPRRGRCALSIRRCLVSQPRVPPISRPPPSFGSYPRVWGIKREVVLYSAKSRVTGPSHGDRRDRNRAGRLIVRTHYVLDTVALPKFLEGGFFFSSLDHLRSALSLGVHGGILRRDCHVWHPLRITTFRRRTNV
jgi:hypothetical protein